MKGPITRARSTLPSTPLLIRILAGLASGLALAGLAQSPSLTLSVGSTGAVSLEWTAVANAQGYRVEYRDALVGGEWLPCPWQDQWPQASTGWVDDAARLRGSRFYRVMAFTNERGAPVTMRLIRSYTTSELTTYLQQNGVPLAAQNGAEFHSVLYQTITADGAPTLASGAVMIPAGVTRALPLLSHQHGTVVLTNSVASQQGGEMALGLAWAGAGYVASLPDYLGMGMGSGPHPYSHARSEATAALDLLRAARVLCGQRGVTLNGQVFLIGYSQGGQATMALTREIETWHTNEFVITASAPMAGPYDMSGTMARVLTSNAPYASPYYLPYALFAFNGVYRLYSSVTQVLVEPYATTLPPLFDGRHSDSQINAAMPAVPAQILRPEFLQAFESDPDHPFRQALRRNDLYRWRPRSPMRMYHCAGDRTVPFANSVVARDNFHTNGATHVTLVDPYPLGDHGSGAAFCFLSAKSWFDSLKQ